MVGSQKSFVLVKLLVQQAVYYVFHGSFLVFAFLDAALLKLLVHVSFGEHWDWKVALFLHENYKLCQISLCESLAQLRCKHFE